MRVKDLMQTAVFTIRSDASVAELCELMQFHHVNGVPVVDADGGVLGIVTEEDVLYGALGLDLAASQGGQPVVAGPPLDRLLVGDIMTSPAISVGEEMDLVDVCTTLWKMRIHHAPVVQDGKVRGIISAMDLVRAVADGELGP